MKAPPYVWLFEGLDPQTCQVPPGRTEVDPETTEKAPATKKDVSMLTGLWYCQGCGIFGV